MLQVCFVICCFFFDILLLFFWYLAASLICNLLFNFWYFAANFLISYQTIIVLWEVVMSDFSWQVHTNVMYVTCLMSNFNVKILMPCSHVYVKVLMSHFSWNVLMASAHVCVLISDFSWQVLMQWCPCRSAYVRYLMNAG